jgi:hypothetical protein
MSDVDLEKLLHGVQSRTTVQFFNNERFVGIEVGVSRPGWGWGAITISCNLQTGTWHMDDECTSREHVEEFLHSAIPLILDQLYDKGNVKPVYSEDDDISLKFGPKNADEDKIEGK